MTDQSAPGAVEPVLDVRGLSARYGHVEALKGADLCAGKGELIAVLGPNGAGKSTLLRAIMGLIPNQGEVRFEGASLVRRDPVGVARKGVVLVPEGRGIFGSMTVYENLELGAYKIGRNKHELQRRLTHVFELFPRLKERLSQLSGSMSGGEQQMLAVGRAMMADPKVLLLDEPSLGLAPRVTGEILETLGTLSASGLPVVLVEQKAPLALKLACRAYLFSLGRIVATIDPREVKSHDELAQYYFA
ncbi:ABC transporter ATP-binding protein [Mesorhizobium australafricanum]|uniref:ABC transporter ATP-binding protein n=1 Tax=Mesorhizobium australafricanum TaxID=3072311 RepID=A0ABU4WW40_9HYPH|nr:ABC transporter ATP-binding protein [Mesorhizobium sp. VK3E]MDX8440275.1 ABC transporter ATP-binding protein [Mesorhizobium sp. VK3E]